MVSLFKDVYVWSLLVQTFKIKSPEYPIHFSLFEIILVNKTKKLQKSRFKKIDDYPKKSHLVTLGYSQFFVIIEHQCGQMTRVKEMPRN